MAKKKTRYPKRRGQIIRGSIIGIFILAIVAAGIYGMNVLDKQSKSYIMTFDGNKISTEDFNYFNLALAMQGSQDDVKSTALSELSNHLILSKAAKEKGIALTADEIIAAQSDVDLFKNIVESSNIPGRSIANITNDRFLELVSTSLIYNKLFDEVTKNYTVDEADFTAYHEEYLANNKFSEIDPQIKYVVTATAENAEAARAKLVAGSSIDEVIAEYSLYYDDQYPITATSLSKFNDFDEELKSKIRALNVSEFTDVIDLDGAFMVVEVDDIITHTKEEVETANREAYTAGSKNEIFNNEFTKWKEASVIEINEKAYDSYK